MNFKIEMELRHEPFFIVLDNPLGIYSPGEVLSGRVVFKRREAESIKGISLEFEGKARCHWRETEYIKPPHHDNSMLLGDKFVHHERSGPKTFSNSEVFFVTKMQLIGNGEIYEALEPGETLYPFAIQLPPNLFSSFQGQFGRVYYTLKATVNRSMWKTDYHTQQKVLVNALVDLNKVPTAVGPGEWIESKTFCCLCCASGFLTMTVRMAKRGYCPGEIADLEVDVDNQSGKQIYDLSYKLVQTVTCFAEGRRKQTWEIVTRQKRSQSGEPFDDDNWHTGIQIPVIPPTNLGGCRIINVDYAIKVEVHVSGAALNLSRSCPIIIGTIPLLESGHDHVHVDDHEQNIITRKPPAPRRVYF